jgi:hypothetical protein
MKMNLFHGRRLFGVLAVLLGVALCFPSSPAKAGTLLVDFGDPASTSGGTTGPAVTWNDIPTSIALADVGDFLDLVTTHGTPTSLGIRMLARFNGANENGTTTSTLFPANATRDSLYGNTESFNNLENIVPKFQIIGLNAGAAYNLSFYASRTGATDNRETRYTVTGAATVTADLNASGNINTLASLNGVVADSNGEITIELTPGPNNNNANHFTYLGVLTLQSVATPAERVLIDFGAGSAPTGVVEPDPGIVWNNVVTSIGINPAGALEGLLATNGAPSGYNFQMIARFNGANTAGTTASTNFPASATRDSLFGNTAAFSGLSDINPEFKFTGLSSGLLYSFTFFGSRTGAADNRETRYTVTGANTASADLNTANNVDGIVTVSDISPNEAGEITVRLSAGPANNNANRFTYLGVLKLDWAPRPVPALLVDFGAAATTTIFGADDQQSYWNNVVPAVGGSSSGVLTNLLSASGSNTGASLQMVARFNGANANGTSTSTLFPTKATQDSLFGNTATFSGLADVFPIFKLVGLQPGLAYDFTFFGSRMSVGDNRETRYTVTGANAASADLNTSNNETEVARVLTIRPNASGEITIAITPGPNNDNGNQFTYLGVMRVDWVAAIDIRLLAPALVGGNLSFQVEGASGKTYRIQGSETLGAWTDAGTLTLTGTTGTFSTSAATGFRFFRAIE